MVQDIVMKFVAAINNQNLPLIINMMSEDFNFIDTYGSKENKEQMKTGWRGYFDWFPDYRIEVHDYIESDKFSMNIGKASASYLGSKERYWELQSAKRERSFEHIAAPGPDHEDHCQNGQHIDTGAEDGKGHDLPPVRPEKLRDRLWI